MNDLATLQGYMNEEGKFTSLPGKRQKHKQLLMLQHLATKIEKGKKFTEMQINEIINMHTTFKDPATLRRLMWGHKLIKRTLDGTAYWRE
jgi:hypothetical protein